MVGKELTSKNIGTTNKETEKNLFTRKEEKGETKKQNMFNKPVCHLIQHKR